MVYFLMIFSNWKKYYWIRDIFKEGCQRRYKIFIIYEVEGSRVWFSKFIKGEFFYYLVVKTAGLVVILLLLFKKKYKFIFDVN